MSEFTQLRGSARLRGGLLSRAADAEVLKSDPSSVIRLLADAEATGGVLTSHRSTLRDGNPGAPPHFHAHGDELFFVLEGRLRLLVGEEIVTLDEGDLLLVPPYMPHAFKPEAGHDADFLCVFTPGTPRADYFRLLDRLHSGEASWEDVLQTQELYDNHHVQTDLWR
ncbi:cupin domain-containing protein [Hamadaea sp.]|uniref:cupin domain-containing protein n=1 Tax=Hamadaea sp. TaxID=2024425 RepID=UPI0025BD0ACF|nr:cupin domain-containing protein [Hamadaea sp.]